MSDKVTIQPPAEARETPVDALEAEIERSLDWVQRASFIVDYSQIGRGAGGLESVVEHSTAMHALLFVRKVLRDSQLALPAADLAVTPCVFASIDGVATCGTHKLALLHGGVGGAWTCPESNVTFPYGAAFGSHPVTDLAVTAPLEQERFTAAQVQSAIRSFLGCGEAYSESRFGSPHEGYCGTGGWATHCLRWHLANLSVVTATQDHSHCHDLVCSGDRTKPRGAQGVTCSCRGRDTAYAEKAALTHAIEALREEMEQTTDEWEHKRYRSGGHYDDFGAGEEHRAQHCADKVAEWVARLKVLGQR